MIHGGAGEQCMELYAAIARAPRWRNGAGARGCGGAGRVRDPARKRSFLASVIASTRHPRSPSCSASWTPRANRASSPAGSRISVGTERAAAPQGAEDPDEHRWRRLIYAELGFRAPWPGSVHPLALGRDPLAHAGSNLNKAASKGPCRQALPTHIPVSPSEPTMNPQHPSWKFSNQSDFQESAMRIHDLTRRGICGHGSTAICGIAATSARSDLSHGQSRSSCRSRQEVARIS